MTDLGKLAAVALTAALLALTVRRQSPELALAVVLAGGAVLLSAALQYLAVVADFWRALASSAAVADEISGPLARAVGISVLIHLSAALCRDSGEGALAAKLELCGNGACLLILLPLLSRLLRLISDML